MPGWKAFAPILAPVSRDPPEGDGIKKKLNNRKKKNRAIPDVFFGYEIFMVSSGNSIILPDLFIYPRNPYAMFGYMSTIHILPYYKENLSDISIPPPKMGNDIPNMDKWRLFLRYSVVTPVDVPIYKYDWFRVTIVSSFFNIAPRRRRDVPWNHRGRGTYSSQTFFQCLSLTWRSQVRPDSGVRGDQWGGVSAVSCATSGSNRFPAPDQLQRLFRGRAPRCGRAETAES